MNLILLQPDEVDENQHPAAAAWLLHLPAADARARHIVTVLKPEPGATVRVGVVGGGIGKAKVTVLEDKSVHLHPAEEGPCLTLSPPPEAPHLEVLLAMPRPKVMMRLWPVLAQLGVRRVILTNAWRVEKPYFSSHATDPSKYMPELLDGLAQAVCTRVPEVRIEMRLRPFLEDELSKLCPSSVTRLLCHPGPGGVRIADAVAASSQNRAVLLAIGPEGGWIDFELDLFKVHGFQQVSLGPRILTTDVAVVSLISLVMDALAAQPELKPLPQPA